MTTLTAAATDPVYREALATFEALRRLGFPSENIFLLLSGPRDGHRQVSIQLHAQKKTFTVTTGFLKKPRETIKQEWIALTSAVANGSFPQDELARIWNESECREKSVQFVAALTGKGFFIPKGMQ